MLAQIRKLLAAPESSADGPDQLQIAVAVLLVEAARMDDNFDDAERAVIERLLAEKFELTQAATRDLLALAEATAERSNQLHPFTRLAVQRMDPEQRIRLIEMLWEIAYADGVLDPEEDALLRRVAGLIYVSDADRVAGATATAACSIASIGVTPTPALMSTTGVTSSASVNEPRGALTSTRLPARTFWYRKPLASPCSFLTPSRIRRCCGSTIHRSTR